MATASPIQYTASGSEGSVVVFTALIAKIILLAFLGDNIVSPVLSAPDVDSYVFDTSTGTITFGAVIQPNQIITILYR